MWLKQPDCTILRRHATTLVLVDKVWMPHGDELEQRFDPVTTNLVYIRFLGERKAIEAITTRWKREVIDPGEGLERRASIVSASCFHRYAMRLRIIYRTIS